MLAPELQVGICGASVRQSGRLGSLPESCRGSFPCLTKYVGSMGKGRVWTLLPSTIGAILGGGLCSATVAIRHLRASRSRRS